MIKIVAVAAVGAALGWGGWISQAHGVPMPAGHSVGPQVALSSIGKRERMARLVAETAAITAERTAREQLARRALTSPPEQTAAR